MSQKHRNAYKRYWRNRRNYRRRLEQADNLLVAANRSADLMAGARREIEFSQNNNKEKNKV